MDLYCVADTTIGFRFDPILRDFVKAFEENYPHWAPPTVSRTAVCIECKIDSTAPEYMWRENDWPVHTVHDLRPNYPGVLWPMPQGPENRPLIRTSCKQDKLVVLDWKQFIGMISDESFTHIITHSNPILSRMSRRGSCLLRLNHD